MAAFPIWLPPQPIHPFFNAAPGGAYPFYQPQYHPGNSAPHTPKPPEQTQQAERANTQAEELATMRMKIAELENDLHRSLARKTKPELAEKTKPELAEKMKPELATQDNTRKEKQKSETVDSSVAKMQVAFLEKELTRTKRMNIALKAKLGQTTSLLYKLTSIGIFSKDIPSLKDHQTSDTAAEVSSDEECLIDLLDPNLTTSSGEGTTAVEASTESSEYDKGGSHETEEVVEWPTAPTDSFSSTSSSSSYIQHFVKKSQDQPCQQSKESPNVTVQDTGIHSPASVRSNKASADTQTAVVDDVDQNCDEICSQASAYPTSSPSQSTSFYNGNKDSGGYPTQSPKNPLWLPPDMKGENERPLHKTWVEYMQAMEQQKRPTDRFLDNTDILRRNLEASRIKSQPSSPQVPPTPRGQGRLSPPNLTTWAKALFMKGRSSQQELRWSSEAGMARHGLRPRCDFFQSNTQCDQAKEVHYEVSGLRAGYRRTPEFFKYGIRYIPRPIDENVFRTILINNLPDNTTALDVLQKVRGGLVLNAHLVQDPTQGQGKAALITFLDESAATAYAGFAAEHPIQIHGTTIRVKRLSTPTWPTPHSTLELVTNAKATRCFEIPNMRKGATLSGIQEVLKFPGMATNGLEFSHIRDGTTLQLRFTSIQYAIQAYEMYQACARRWLPDPCAQPVETLLTQTEGATKVEDGGSGATDSM